MRRMELLTLATLGLVGCGETVFDDPGDASDPHAPCTDPLKCCPPSEMACTGDPDKGMVCSCTSLWDCSKDPSKCEQDRQVPGGGGSWSCTWSEMQYVCTGNPSSGAPSGKGWSCSFDEASGKWVCKKSPPNPSNKPDGTSTWTCTVDNELGKIKCERKDNPPPPLPPTTSDAGAPKSDSKPPSFPPPPVPPKGKECVPGSKMWCDGMVYCGWGLVVCGPDGRWKRKFAIFGIGPLDCMEPADGRRPLTKCACYHTYFNKACCENPQCVLPPATNGQICPKSPGKLCDYCNAAKPECIEPGGKCLVMASGESFCSKACSTAKPCPSGYSCNSVGTQGSTVSQCMPSDLSCYK